ncbi:helix-turn-helix domain-containing protein [Nocardioides panaciterrulae]|uniref:DNA-directed RNA polymerase specialized sigma24 family protein n=1 Tax=Nocardioides panaciterrulae TaxID=661492 RepID=A0A7Y9E464_9ACTN|nr:helix-turn-helix domain-containing protein [Nocardioides panaciterrulae]NYD40561.1 DNA-directed RNA polymerase specialized sigma24 family protein [Nocardioides panaciterrulae]
MSEPHPLLQAVAPLLERLDARVVAADALRPDDVPLVWDGRTVAGVRLPAAAAPAAAGPGAAVDSAPAGEAAGSLEALIEEVARELGGGLADLPRADKQRAVRLLEERGAFAYRKSAETIAEAIGVSRFTVYNYLNRAR